MKCNGYKKYLVGAVLFFYLILPPGVRAENASGQDPVWMRIANGWKALVPLSGQYAEVDLTGQKVELQDAYHALLLPENVGVNLTFADKKELPTGSDLLSSHAVWEIGYWKKHSSKLESKLREDLSKSNRSIRVTQIKLFNDKGESTGVYLVSLAAKTGVVAVSISPIKNVVEAKVKELVDSMKITNKNLTPEVIKQISLELKKSNDVAFPNSKKLEKK